MNEMVKIQHQQWARDLDDQRRSGLTQREWCRIHGISIQGLHFFLGDGFFARGIDRNLIRVKK